MPNAFKSTLLVLLLFISTQILISSAQAAARVGDPQVVEEVEWGEVLFSYYRGDELDALTRVLAREEQGVFVKHKNTANLFAAGLLIDLGLPIAAQKRIDLMESVGLSAENKSRLAMVLARVYYRLQLYNSSWEQLHNLNERHLDDRDVQRRRLMKAQMLFRNKKYEEASAQLESVRYNGNLQLYAEYNNGITLLQLNDPVAHTKGYQILEAITTLQPLDQEQYAIKDQAILALALEALKTEKAGFAQQLLTNMRLDGLVSNEGLLMLGWSFAESEDYEQALIYWLQLSEMEDLLEPAVQEAWLAVPYAYQKQEDFKSALLGYEKALDSHILALEELDNLEAREAWRDLLDTRQTAEVSFTQTSPGFQRQLVGDASFFELLKQWTQLQQWDNNLQISLRSLEPIKIMLETNEQRFLQKSVEVNQRLEEIRALDLDSSQSSLNEVFEQQTNQAVPEMLLPEEDAKIWQRLQEAEELAASLSEEALGEKGEKLRRFKGVGLWSLHRSRDHNLWQGQQDKTALADEIKKLERQMEQLEELLSRPRQPLPEALARVDDMKIKGIDVVLDLFQLKVVYEEKMAARFISMVNARRAALTNLAEQANVALARLRFRSLTPEDVDPVEDSEFDESELEDEANESESEESEADEIEKALNLAEENLNEADNG